MSGDSSREINFRFDTNTGTDTFYSDNFVRAYRRKRRTGGREAVHNSRILVILLAFAIIVIAVLGLCLHRTSVSADSVPMNKYYTSVEADQGDSIWGIAEDNMSPGYNDVSDLVDEIYNINGLRTDHIEAGQKLIVPYYSTEYKD